MIPTSTNVSVQLKNSLPANVDAIAVLVHKDQNERSPEISSIDDSVRDVVVRLVDTGSVTGKSNEVTHQLLDSSRGKAKRLLVIGLGDITKFSAECLREAGATLAKTMRKGRINSAALIV